MFSKTLESFALLIDATIGVVIGKSQASRAVRGSQPVTMAWNDGSSERQERPTGRAEVAWFLLWSLGAKGRAVLVPHRAGVRRLGVWGPQRPVRHMPRLREQMFLEGHRLGIARSDFSREMGNLGI